MDLRGVDPVVIKSYRDQEREQLAFMTIVMAAEHGTTRLVGDLFETPDDQRVVAAKAMGIFRALVHIVASRPPHVRKRLARLMLQDAKMLYHRDGRWHAQARKEDRSDDPHAG